MIIRIKVIPNSHEDGIIQGDPLIVKVTAAPDKGKANKAVIKLLKSHFDSEVSIVSGLKSRNKVVEIG